jgi:hypothetical protein
MAQGQAQARARHLLVLLAFYRPLQVLAEIAAKARFLPNNKDRPQHLHQIE